MRWVSRLNYSNTDPAIYQQISDNPTSKESKERFIELLKQAKGNLSVNLNERGKVIIQDNMHSNTKMQFMLLIKTRMIFLKTPCTATNQALN